MSMPKNTKTSNTCPLRCAVTGLQANPEGPEPVCSIHTYLGTYANSEGQCHRVEK